MSNEVRENIKSMLARYFGCEGYDADQISHEIIAAITDGAGAEAVAWISDESLAMLREHGTGIVSSRRTYYLHNPLYARSSVPEGFVLVPLLVRETHGLTQAYDKLAFFPESDRLEQLAIDTDNNGCPP
jgi:hypothetical protein